MHASRFDWQNPGALFSLHWQETSDNTCFLCFLLLERWIWNLGLRPGIWILGVLERDRAGERWQRGSEWAVLSWFYLTHWEWVHQLVSLWTIQTLLETPCLLREDIGGAKKGRLQSHRSTGRSRNSEEGYTWRDVHRVSGSLLLVLLSSANFFKLNTFIFWIMQILQE